MEEFRKIATYKYSISNLGNVRNDMTNRILKPGIDGNGYYVVILYKNGKPKTMKLHRLIALAFIDNLNDKKCVDHKNNNKLDNNINNLKWCTYQENNQNVSMKSNNSSGIKSISWFKRDSKWRAKITLDGIQIHIGYYDTIEDATIARVNKANQAFGQYKNACEGINHGAKPMKIRKVKQVVKPIVQPNIKQIFDDIVQLNNTLKVESMKL
jgi:hypothetical protein